MKDLPWLLAALALLGSCVFRGGDPPRFYEPDSAALHGAVGDRPAAAVRALHSVFDLGAAEVLSRCVSAAGRDGALGEAERRGQQDRYARDAVRNSASALRLKSPPI